jgi:ATP-dependent Clp protease ATP-binding subunit ClpA
LFLLRQKPGRGKKINCREVVVFMTSNCGAEHFLSDSFGICDITRNNVMDELNKIMRPELINRFDSILFFNALTERAVLDIFNIALNDVRKRVCEKLPNVQIAVTPSAEEWFVKNGYDHKNGARPMLRLVEKIVQWIAEQLLHETLKNDAIITVDAKNDQLVFSM